MPRSRPLLSAALAGLLLTGCTAGSGDDGAGSMPAAGEAAAPQASSGAGATVADQAAGDGVLGRTAVLGSTLVRTADLVVSVDDVRAAADRAGGIVGDAGGIVGSERSNSSGGTATAELVLRVPPERFDAVLDALAGLGEERQRSVGSEDVGETLVDLETRLAAQRASVERVRALLAEAADVAQVVQIESELTRRTADLESLQGRLAVLRDRVALSGITLRLTTSDDAPLAAGERPGFLDGLRGGWQALLATGTVLASVVGALLPFTPLLVVGWLVVARLKRRSPA